MFINVNHFPCDFSRELNIELKNCEDEPEKIGEVFAQSVSLMSNVLRLIPQCTLNNYAEMLVDGGRGFML